MPSGDAPAHEFVVADESTPDLLAQCKRIRFSVFFDEQQFPLDTQIDKYDEPGTSKHILLRLVPALEPIGVIRIVHLSATDKKIGRVCLLEPYRNYGFGKGLLLAAHDYLCKPSVTAHGEDGPRLSVSLHSQIYAKGFYARYGYEEEGSEFDEDGSPFQRMVRYL